ncbi:hypothetical protein BRC81_11720 [Halobacteriales archaeon QS_1_68_20]|nr:MAG: hypothetical protein BRC81_11720 [Halobacteriales archaeon QS_1_68_20]
MYSMSEIVEGLTNPHKIVREFYRLQTRGDYYRPGIDVFEADWDTLVILDACRYDYFSEMVDFPGDLSCVESRGSATPEWLTGNFRGRDLHDVVYVSANGFYEKLRDALDASVHAWIGTYQSEYRDDVGAVDPKTLTERAIEAAAEYPNKRLLVHYAQPHAPYIGPEGREYWGDVRGLSVREMIDEVDDPIDRKREKLREAYRENLQIGLDAVGTLVDRIEGKTVISSDHGELLGERRSLLPIRLYDHPRGVHPPELVNVPWFELPYDSRREVVAEPPEERQAETDPAAIRNLQELGYHV